MKYYSLNNKSDSVSFKEALINGLAPDKGLYFPSNIKRLSSSFFDNLTAMSNSEIAFNSIKQFIGNEIPEKKLLEIIEETINFDFPLVEINNNLSFIELFHGPTMAFKDVGARFMSRCLGYFISQSSTKQNFTVLVATSGDTGGAVASGFYDIEGVNVVILYPSGKVSEVQEKQLTTLGKNITALEIDGTFDDCQSMVKNAFLDSEITNKLNLTSANSINIGRWLPQMFYFFFAYRDYKLKNKDKISFSVPSGNFGNICAGMMTKKIGLPIDKFIASNNLNNVVERYLKNGLYKPKNTIHTISNAMDVGNPSNFIRISELYNNKLIDLKADLFAYSYSDSSTISSIKELIDDFDYIADPHAAIGYLGAKEFINLHPKANCIILETAHPIKFTKVIQGLNIKLKIPTQVESILEKKKKSIFIKNYESFKNYLIDS